MRLFCVNVYPLLRILGAGFFLMWGTVLNAQQSPVLTLPCNPANPANSGVCPADCVFPVAVERGCNCFDGQDNDGDGLRDAADPDCATYYGLTFVGAGSDCSITPPGAATPFDLVGPPVRSSQNTADTQSKVAVGDVDGNGVPDALITSKWNAEVRLVSTTAQAGVPALNGNQSINFAEGDVIADFRLAGNAITSRFDDALRAATGVNNAKTSNLLLEHEVLIADINRSGRAEIFGVVSNRQGAPTSPPTSFFLIGLEITAYGAQGLKLMPGYPVYLGTNRPGTFGIADMDGDSRAEVYLRDRIFAAETGRLLASEGGKNMTNTALWDVDVSSAPVAADIRAAGSDSFVMELIVGSKIYRIPNISSNRSPATPQALTLWRDMNTLTFDINNDGVADRYFVKLMNDPDEYGIDTHSSTSIADIDKDGNIDVVVTGALNSSSGRTAVFYWNVQANTVTGILTPNSAELGINNTNQPLHTNYANGWIWGTGRVNLGDANADGNLDLLFIAGNQLFCYTANGTANSLTKLWERTINDTRSGVLTLTIYDFNNDGAVEVVYRDAAELAIVDGLTGQNKLWSRICQSHTYTEGPVIADVNGDGNTDICVACNFSDNASQFNINAGIQQQALGQIRMYFSSGEWLPTRKVWNQPGYFVVNINDDLTLPFPQFDIATSFQGNCPVGPPGTRQPFNVFLNQVPFMSANGCPVYPAPDLTFIGDDPNDPNIDPNNPDYFPKVFVEAPICGNLDITVGFNITNSGDLPISTTIPVSFYNGSPYDANNPGTLLYTTSININNLEVRDTLKIGDLRDDQGNIIRTGDLPGLQFNGPGTIFTMYVVLYDDGTSVPIDTLTNANNNGQVQSGAECDITNNFWPILVVPKPFTVNIDSVDNIKCDPLSPDVGQLISHISVGPDTVIDLSPYAFAWYTSADTTGNRIPGENNYNIQGLATGDYYLVITNVEKGCSVGPILGEVGGSNNPILPDITFTTQDQTTCEPPNGLIQAAVVGGNAGYEFLWEDFGGPIGVTGPLLENVEAGTYTLIVTETLSGCFRGFDVDITRNFERPSVEAFKTDVVNCINAQSGSVTAVANNSVADSALYRFDWYFYEFNPITNSFFRGSKVPGSAGNPTLKGLDIGLYEVEITELATGCLENNINPDTVRVVDARFLPEVRFTELAPQTSCDPNQPNARLQADAFFNGAVLPAGDFTFEWFVGQNTVTAHTGGTSGTNGQIAENVRGGGQAYTVRITTANFCSVTSDSVVNEIIIYPQVALITSPNSVCDQALGFTGSVASTVTFNGAPVTAGNPDYSFEWYNGSVPTGTPVNLNQQNYTALDGGFYTLVVTNTVLNCPSLATVEQVLNVTALPALTTSSSPSTNCDPALVNGVAQVLDVDGTGVTSPNYSFAWYNGNGPVGTVQATTPVYGSSTPGNGLQGGAGLVYTVLVRNLISGCENTAVIAVGDASELPVITLTPVNNGICDPALTNPPSPFTGRVTANVTNQVGALTDYSFVFGGGNTTGTQTANVYDRLNGGPVPYTAVATHTYRMCLVSGKCSRSEYSGSSGTHGRQYSFHQLCTGT
jgi:hypothetical protein